MSYLPQDSLKISNTTANAAEEEITSVEINETNFPDAIFRKYVTNHFDTNEDMVLSDKEIAYVTKIDVYDMGISDLTGIEYFTDLAFLNCNKNNLTALDVSNNTTLTNLSCSDNQIASLDLSNNTALTDLYCTRNQLSSLDVTNNTALKYLYCYDNQLSSLNLSNNKLLENLNCDNNNITTLDVSNNKSLVYLICDNNNLTTLDVNNNKKLVLLCCNGNQLTSFDVSNNKSLTAFLCEDNKYEIALTGNTFDLSTLPIEFDVTKASEWTNGTVEGNILTVEDVTKEVTYKYDCGNEYSETFTLISQKKETPVSTTTTVPTTTAPETTTTTTKIYQSVNYSCSLSVYPYNEADTIYEIGEELDLSTICVNGHGKITWDLGTSYSYVDIPYMSLDKCSSVTVDASEFDNTKPGTYTIYVKWHDAVDSFEVTVVESDNAETPAATATTPAATTTTAAPKATTTTTAAPKATTTTTAAPKTTDTTTTTTVPLTTAMFTTTTFAPPSYSCSLSVYPYDEADTIYEIGEELDYSTICVHGYGTMTSFGSTSYIDIPYMSLADCSSFVTVDASEFDNTKPGTYTIYVKWYDTVDSFDVTVVESDNAETPAATETTPAATTTTAASKTTDTTTTTTVPLTTAMFTTTTFAPPSYSCSLSVYPYDEADTIYEIGEELDLSTICVNGHGTMTSFGNTSYIDIPYMSLADCSSFVTVDASEFDNTKPGTYTIYVEWCDAVDSFEVTVIDPDNPTAIPGVGINETNFPDPVFRQYLAKNFDKNKDGRLSDKEIADVTVLYLDELGISDLTGIQHFENLFSLWCYDNNLTTLDVSNNTELEILACGNNQLTSLDVSHNTLLTDLMCSNNQLASVDLSNTNCLEGWEFGVGLTNNKHRITITDNTFDLSTLPAGFDVSKASDWTNATVKGNILTIEDITKEVTYTYDCGLGFSETFTLVPQIEETPAETTTTTAAPETTITTTATTTVTTTPATTTPEDDLPQTGFSKLYNCIPVSAGALVLLGMYAVKKSKKEDEEE